jgi:hypothetical protein
MSAGHGITSELVGSQGRRLGREAAPSKTNSEGKEETWAFVRCTSRNSAQNQSEGTQLVPEYKAFQRT